MHIALQIALESPRQPDVIALIADLDAYQDSLYPADARYALDLDALARPEVLFAVARNDSGVAVGCGAIVLAGDQGELKRMFVRPEARGTGAGSAIIRFLESAAHERGGRTVQLETGPYQPEALAFYARHGYTRCAAFGGYPEHPLSVFMTKSWAGAV